MAKLRTAFFAPGLSGSSGGAVFVHRADGSVIIREKPVVRDRQTPAQLELRALMRRASQAFRELDAGQQAAWQTYAESEQRRFHREGLGTAPRAYNLFTGLAYQVLRMDPQAAIPVAPPVSGFTGDSLTFSLESLPGFVRFTADAANGPDVVTEVLMTRVATSVTHPNDRAYRHQAFVAFTPGSLSFDAPVPGHAWQSPWLACAVRFLRPSTGQSSALVVLGTVRIA